MLVLVVFYIVEYYETQTNLYLNKEDVLKEKAISRGWIPLIIPNSSYEIVETHDIDTNEIDTNEIEGSFKYQDIDEKVFLSKLTYKNRFFIWKDFLFKIDKEKNEVLFFSNK